MRPGLALAVFLGFAAIAYRSLLAWDPGDPGLPSAGWLVFGISDTAPQIVFAIAAGLVFQRRARIARAVGDPGSPWLGSGLLLTSIALFAWGTHTGAPEFLLLSLVLLVSGSALLLLGRRATRELTLPLLVLLFAIPIPGIVLNHIVPPLQLASASVLNWLLELFGFPVVREGVVLQLPTHGVHVLDTCSGLRAILILTMLAVCWVSFFSMPTLAGVLLVASAPLIAFAVNAGRIFVVSLNPEADLSEAHAYQGAAICLAGIALLYGVDALLSRALPGPRPAEPINEPTRGPSSRGWQRRAIPPALALLAVFAASLVLPSGPSQSGAPPQVELPETLDGWARGEVLPVDGLFLGRALVPAHAQRRYEKDGERVSVFVAYDDRTDPSFSVWSPNTGLPGPDWTVEERRLQPLGPLVAHSLAARSGARRVSVLHWYDGVEGLGMEMIRAWLAMDRSAFRRSCAAVAVRLQTDQAPPGERAGRSQARLLELARALHPYVARLACPGSDPDPARPPMEPAPDAALGRGTPTSGTT